MTRSICRADKHSGRNLSVLANANTPGGVFVMHSALQPRGMSSQTRAPWKQTGLLANYSLSVWSSGPSACSRTGCRHGCAVDLLPEGPEFRCVPPETGEKRPRESPSISRTVPTSSLSDPTLAGILSLICTCRARQKDCETLFCKGKITDWVHAPGIQDARHLVIFSYWQPVGIFLLQVSNIYSKDQYLV